MFISFATYDDMLCSVFEDTQKMIPVPLQAGIFKHPNRILLNHNKIATIASHESITYEISHGPSARSASFE